MYLKLPLFSSLIRRTFKNRKMSFSLLNIKFVEKIKCVLLDFCFVCIFFLRDLSSVQSYTCRIGEESRLFFLFVLVLVKILLVYIFRFSPVFSVIFSFSMSVIFNTLSRALNTLKLYKLNFDLSLNYKIV